MRLNPQISLSSAPGRIAIQTTPGRVKPGVDKLELSIDNAAGGRLSMHTEHARINIDQTEAFASAGLKKPIRLALDWCKRGWQEGMQVIATIAREGVEYLRIENGGNPAASQAKRLGYEDLRLTLKSMPSVPPEITVEQGSVEVSTDSGFRMQWKPVMGQGQYTPAQVDITLAQAPRLDISLTPGVELHFPQPSRNVDVTL